MPQVTDHGDIDRKAALYRSLSNIRPNDALISDIEEFRTVAKSLGDAIFTFCPHSRERSLALTHLEETVMWAVKSIVVN